MLTSRLLLPIGQSLHSFQRYPSIFSIRQLRVQSRSITMPPQTRSSLAAGTIEPKKVVAAPRCGHSKGREAAYFVLDRPSAYEGPRRGSSYIFYT